MADLDNESQDQENEESSYDAKSDFEAMRELLAEQSRQMQASMQAVAEAVQKSVQQPEPFDDSEYMTAEEKRIKMLEAEIQGLKSSTKQETQEMIRRERELDNTVVRLAREYPEIQSDAKMQKAVVAEHNALSKAMQDTAEGYELAVQRAARKAGLKPKSERSGTDDFSAPGRKGGSTSATQKKGKSNVAEGTLKWAALLGRDIEDPKVLEGLEKASERQKWLKYQ